MVGRDNEISNYKDLAKCIEDYEDAPKIWNNPGALRWSPFMSYQKGGFARFNTYAEGFEALLHQLYIVCNGKSPAYNRAAKKLGLKDCSELTLLQFFEIYAPSSDKNNPRRYTETVAQELETTIETKMKEFV